MAKVIVGLVAWNKLILFIYQNFRILYLLREYLYTCVADISVLERGKGLVNPIISLKNAGNP